jgi:hypothetical protein
MFFMIFQGTPRQTARTAPEAAGAHISCWIERSTLEEAIAVARAGIEAEGWIVEDPDEAYPVDDETYPPGKSGREFFEQAKVDKEVFVFNTCPESGY